MLFTFLFLEIITQLHHFSFPILICALRPSLVSFQIQGNFSLIVLTHTQAHRNTHICTHTHMRTCAHTDTHPFMYKYMVLSVNNVTCMDMISGITTCCGLSIKRFLIEEDRFFCNQHSLVVCDSLLEIETTPFYLMEWCCTVLLVDRA